MAYPKLTEEVRIRRLQPPTGTVNMVLDTDTFNEIDGQFARCRCRPSRRDLQGLLP